MFKKFVIRSYPPIGYVLFASFFAKKKYSKFLKNIWKRAEDFFYGDSSQESVQEEIRFDVPQQQQRSEDDHQSNNNNFTMGEAAPAVGELGGPVTKKRRGMKKKGRTIKGNGFN